MGGLFEAAAQDAPTAADMLKGGTFLSYVHAAFARGLLGVKADAAIGVSSGETTALFTFGAWDDLATFYEDFFASGAFDREVGGRFDAVRRAWQLSDDQPVDWETWRLFVPVDALRAGLAGESRVYLQVVYTDGAAQMVGESAGCARVIARLPKDAQVFRRQYNLAVHSPVVKAFADTWRRVHRRPTRPVAGVRFYTHAIHGPYELEIDATADMLTQQAVQTIEFPKVIERA